MQLLFSTYNDKLSELITKVLDEPVSHVAIYENGMVVHMTPDGMKLEKYEEYLKHNNVKMIYLMANTYGFTALSLYEKYRNVKYDYLAALALGIRARFPKWMTKKVDLWNVSGMLICTELVNEALRIKQKLTPYQLFIFLKNTR